MSTFGTAFVVDVPTGASVGAEETLAEASDEISSVPLDGGLVRLSRYSSDLEAIAEEITLLLAGLEGARAALAEDFDEYGARFRVLVGGVGHVYQAFVLNADPEDPEAVEAAADDHEEDPRADDLTGSDAARRAAEVFDVDPTAMVEADRTYRSTAWEQIGVVGGPFPWWDALGLECP